MTARKTTGKATGKKAAASRKKPTAKAAPKKKATSAAGATRKKTPARKKAASTRAAAAKPAAGKRAAPKADAKRTTAEAEATAKPAATAKPKPERPAGAVTASQVNLGHVFALKPRVSTSFKQADFLAARHLLEDESYGSLGEAARAVAEKALALTNDTKSKRGLKRGR